MFLFFLHVPFIIRIQCPRIVSYIHSEISPPFRIPQQKRSHNTRGDANAANNGDAQQAFLGDLVVDELAQVGGLEVGGLLLE